MERLEAFLQTSAYQKIKKTIYVIVIVFFALIVWRAFDMIKQDKINAEVLRIQNVRLTLADVMGENLPPDPGEEADKTIAGIDANENGIRDDVELAIFKEYPNSAKTRAVLLQYALALQTSLTISNLSEETVNRSVSEISRADTCVADTLVPRISKDSFRTTQQVNEIYEYVDFVEAIHFNTENRKQAEESFYNFMGSFGNSENEICDIDLSTLPN